MDISSKHCVPCEGGTPPFSDEQEKEYLAKISGWSLLRDGEHKIRKQFKFDDFKGSLDFVNKVGKIAEDEGHHPDIYIFYNKVQIDLFTHAVGGLSENDFILASKIDKI